jgi:hypothetical protein
MSKPDKKRRRELKRDAKRREARRRESISPVKRLARAPGEIECWISEDFEELGQAQIFVFKRGGGQSGVACFLVDRGVVGLKDAWTRLGVEPADLSDMLERSKRNGIHMRPGTIEEARCLVAGGVRWAHDNGMRLPSDWAKTASVIGGVGDWASADVSRFAREFAGHPEDLRQRLRAESFESYLQRNDVDFVFSSEAPYMDLRTGRYHSLPPGSWDTDDADNAGDADDSDEDFDDLSSEELFEVIPAEHLSDLQRHLTPAATALAADTAAWLAARDQSPGGPLREAWLVLMLAKMIATRLLSDADADAEPNDDDEMQIADLSGDFIALLERRFQADNPGLHEAIGHALHYLETDPMRMSRAVLAQGMGDPPSSEPDASLGDAAPL